MEKNNYEQFLVAWDLIVMILAGLSVVIGILILIIHRLRLAGLKEYKEKYDYLNANDTKMIFYSIIAFAVGITLFINTVQSSTVSISYIWFMVRLFIALCFGTLVIYVSYLMLKFAYPSTLEKKLKKWRYKPRTNKKTGNAMKLLSEEEEDVHLDEGMQAEENVFSVDYDVWVDEETGDVQIEKYPGHLQALQCNSCGFQTMKLLKEEILYPPTSTEEGEMKKNYKCTYCSAKRTRTVRIARLSQDDEHYILPEHPHFKEEEKINLVNIEIHTSNGKTKIFEFSSTKQAGEFLQEYKHEQVD
jgi:hypothetical protein